MMSTSNFSHLRELHKCGNDLLQSPQIKQVLVQEMSSVREISESSIMKMLDMCGATRDVLVMVKDHIQDLQKTFRRAKIEASHNFNAQITTHGIYRKKLKKELVKSLRDVKGIKDKYFTSDLSLVDHNLIVVVHVLRQVREATISTLESLLSLISMPTTVTIVHSERSSSFASKLLRRNCQRLLERCDSMEVRMANKRLEEVESAMEVLEVGFEFIIRRFIHTRVLLLNILNN